jgi:hypothetical protein
MSWSAIPTTSGDASCLQPYSFFFDLIAPIWKCSGSPREPLHRVCTLARKGGATHLALECALHRPDVQEEIDALDNAHGGGGSANAACVSFVVCDRDALDINSVDGNGILAQVVVINYCPAGSPNFTKSFVHEAILGLPSAITSADGTRLAFTELGEVVPLDDPRARVWQIIRDRMLWQNSYESHADAQADLDKGT